MSVCVIVNPRSREVAEGRATPDDISACLSAHGIAADLHVTQAPGQATDIAREAARRGYEKVIAAGGDGTINEVVNGIAHSGVAMGLLPLGTANALARSVGLRPGDVKAACGLIAQGHTSPRDLGSINERYFACMAGIGLDAQVAADTGDTWQSVLGVHAFVGQFMATLAKLRPWKYEAQVDGKPMSGRMWAIFICNTPQYTWRVRLVPNAAPDDGELDLVFLGACSRAELLAIATDIFVGGRSAERHRHMQIVRARHLTVSTQPSAPWQAEGDVGGTTPVECKAEPGALNLIVPER